MAKPRVPAKQRARGELVTVMELRALHVLSALDPSDPSTVRVWCTETALYKHFLSKNLRGGEPNPVHDQLHVILLYSTSAPRHIDSRLRRRSIAIPRYTTSRPVARVDISHLVQVGRLQDPRRAANERLVSDRHVLASPARAGGARARRCPCLAGRGRGAPAPGAAAVRGLVPTRRAHAAQP